MRRIICFPLILLLIWVSFSAHTFITASAEGISSKDVLFLEITVDGKSQNPDFSGVNQYNISVDTISMKRFVAGREALDGKYDGIIIGEGTYSGQGVNGRNHNTSAVQNDITNLKANEVIERFIDKKQPVFLHKSSINNGGILQQKFSNLTGSSVMYFENSGNNSFNKVFNSFMQNDFTKKPSFNITSAPAGWNSSYTNGYKAGDTISFRVNIHNQSTSRMKLRLYIDQDFNDRFDAEEVVREVDVRSLDTSLNYELPFGFSGPRMWKLELVQPHDNVILSDYETGQFLFEDKPVEINVLQVYRNSNSSLQRPNNMNQDYLTQNNQYKINIDVTGFDVFNNSKNASSQSALYSHEVINGKYDMVIFGFSDTYNYANLSQGAVGSLKKYIDSQQSVMFTHDTIFNNNNVWVNNFMEATGQKAPETNLGNGAPNTSQNTKKVNEGLMTSFPFDLPENVRIATTHNQYYTLDLEDENVIPWYNIIGSSRDENDSWNHYYTYSKGNITYSGTGHTSTNFPDPEQRLFVNTMYRAFFGANHAPEITVHTPENEAAFPINQTIPLSFTVEDYDLSAKTNDVKVYMNDSLIHHKESSRNGETINLQLAHGMPAEGKVRIRIVATDEKGAETVDERTVNVFETENLLELSRTILPVKPVYEVRNDLMQLNYELKPKPVHRSDLAGNQSISLESIQFKEVFPPNIEVVELPDYLTKTGSIDIGYTVSGTIPRIEYSRDFNGSQNGGSRGADPVKFSIGITSMQSGLYSLADSSLTYDQVYGKENNGNNNKENYAGTFTEYFNRIDFVAGNPLTEVRLTESIALDKGIERNLTASGDFSYSPQEAKIEKIEWSSSDSNVITVTQNGIIKAVGNGNAIVTVTVTDVFGNKMTKKSNVAVRIPIESIVLERVEVFVGETAELPMTVNPSDASGSIEISLENRSIASVNAAARTVTGLQPGTTKAVARGINANGTEVVAETIITVKTREISSLNVEPGEVTINKFDVFNSFTVSVEPEYADTESLEWTSSDLSVAEVLSPGVIRGTGAGTAKVYVQAPNGVRDEVIINVLSPLVDAGFKKEVIVIGKGDTFPLSSELQITPADATDIESIVYTDITGTGDNPFINLNNNGDVSGVRIGENNIVQVVVTTEGGNTYTDTITVHVRENEDVEDADNGDRY